MIRVYATNFIWAMWKMDGFLSGYRRKWEWELMGWGVFVYYLDERGNYDGLGWMMGVSIFVYFKRW
jgi:hypothetical protein